MSRINTITQSVSGKVNVAVHDGKFHLDELLALTWLQLAGIEFVWTRTRNPQALEQADLVFDVGGKFEGKWYDHHQRDFNQLWATTGPDGVTVEAVKLAACGLVWRDLHRVVLDRLMPNDSEDVKHMVELHILQDLVIPADASDNGQLGQLADISLPNLAQVVGAYNSPDPQMQDDAFADALSMIWMIVWKMIQQWIYQAREYQNVLTAMREQADSNIFVMDRMAPWLQVALDHWDEMQHFQVCVFPNVTPGEWRIQSFPGSQTNRFATRCPAPESWRGKKTGDFSDLPYGDQVIFVHAGGFIGGIKGTRDDAARFAHDWIVG